MSRTAAINKAKALAKKHDQNYFVCVDEDYDRRSHKYMTVDEQSYRHSPWIREEAVICWVTPEGIGEVYDQ